MKDDTIDNQQETLTQAEIGWLAGIIDGEGTIALNVRKKNWKGWKGVGVDLNLTIVNTDATIIEKAQEIIQKMGIEPYINERKPSSIFNTYKGKGKTILSCTISAMSKIKKVLLCIIDHLVGDKKARANLILKFINKRQSSGKKYKKYTKKDWQIVEDFYKLSGGKAWDKIKESSQTIREALGKTR